MAKRIFRLRNILLVLLVIIIAGIWYWESIKKQLVRHKLEQAIHDKSNGLYVIQYDSMELDEITGFLSMSSVKIGYDSARFVQLQKEETAPYVLFKVFIPHIQIDGVKTPRALIGKEIKGRMITIQDPVIEIFYTNAGKDSSRNLPGRDLYKQILGKLDLIQMDSVKITGAQIITSNLKTKKTYVKFMNASVSMRDVMVDSLSEKDPQRLLYAKEVYASCEQFVWESKDKHYQYKIDSIAFNSVDSSIRIKNVFILPSLNEDAFAKSYPYQTDRMNFALHNITCKRTDFYQLSDEVFQTDSLFIGGATFNIYRDRTLPSDGVNRVGTYPHQVLLKMPFKIAIKNAIVGNSFLEYKEKGSITNQSGKVQLWNLHATVSNITNQQDMIRKNNQMVFNIGTRLLNQPNLSVKWTFYLGNPDGRFDIHGHLDGSDARIYNVLAEPMGPARFNSGKVRSLDFDLSGTNYKVNGRVALLYDDLHVSLLKKADDSIHYKKRKLVSLIGNFKIKNSNPVKDNEPRIATVDYQRDIHVSIFNTAWKSLFDGLQQVTGVK